MKYRKGNNNKILLSLDRGDLINKTFENFSKDNKIVFAWLNGIGAIEDPEIGFYCIDEKSYHRKKFQGEYELTSLMGNITLRDKKYYSHTHITFSDIDYNVYGGHLFDAKISAAGEFIMIIDEHKLRREMNSRIGLSFWDLENKFE